MLERACTEVFFSEKMQFRHSSSVDRFRLSPDFRPHRVAVNFGPHQRHSILRTGCLTTDAQDGPD